MFNLETWNVNYEGEVTIRLQGIYIYDWGLTGTAVVSISFSLKNIYWWMEVYTFHFNESKSLLHAAIKWLLHASVLTSCVLCLDHLNL